MAEPRVSIIIVSWNCRELVLECIASLKATTIGPMEIIVVDNASTDGSAEAVARGFPDVKLCCNPENRGFAGGVNVGLREASAELVLLLNPDCRLLADIVTILADELEADRRIGIAGPTILNEDGTLQRSFFRAPSLLGLLLTASYLFKLFPNSPLWNRPFYGGHDPCTPRDVEVISGAAFMFRRALAEAIGEFDEDFFMYAEEGDFCQRARQAGWRVRYIPAQAVVHAGAGSSRLQSRRMLVQMRRSLLRFFSKHRGPLQSFLARLLLALFLALRLPYWALVSALGSTERRADARAQCSNYLSGLGFLLLGREAKASREPPLDP